MLWILCLGWKCLCVKSELAYLWTVNISMALENIRKWKWINQMNEKINRMWKYDMLTQVFNRSGFFIPQMRLLNGLKDNIGGHL